MGPVVDERQEMSGHDHDITELLLQWNGGDGEALERLMPVVYDELRRLATSYLRREHKHRTLDTVALVSEAYLRLVDQSRVQWTNRDQFFALAARMMRRILVDHARSHLYAKRGGGRQRLSLDEAPPMGEERAAELVALHDALTDLAAVDPELVRVVELRFFGGFTQEEVGRLLGQSSRTVGRRWRLARAWLHDELAERAEAR
jgi:RNA polymerase sigma factor (TIGR02999 family)